jgi:hypothetical protein
MASSLRQGAMKRAEVQPERVAAMLNRHRLAHAGLAAISAATTAILIAEGAIAHAICALAATLIYAALCCRSSDHHPS